MGERTEISWCHHTFNPWIGCAKVSAGCQNCYASVDTFARVQRARGLELWGPHAARHRTSAANWRAPLRWARDAAAAGVRRRVFCASLADVFEGREDLEPMRQDLWKLIDATPALDWMLLTKRPGNIRKMLPAAWLASPRPWVWLGTSVEGWQVNPRVAELLETPAAIRFISAEPLLDCPGLRAVPYRSNRGFVDALTGETEHAEMYGGGGDHVFAPLPKLDLVIVGSESGPDARPMQIGRVRALVDDCRSAGVAVFVKQIATEEGRLARDPKGGDPRFWPPGVWPREMPEVRT